MSLARVDLFHAFLLDSGSRLVLSKAFATLAISFPINSGSSESAGNLGRDFRKKKKKKPVS